MICPKTGKYCEFTGCTDLQRTCDNALFIQNGVNPILEEGYEPTFHEIRNAAQETYVKYSTFKNAAAWHTWKQAFHLGQQFYKKNKQI